ncbi:Lsr2 dimerization domain-containing protein [Gordonia insulae]|uniref:Nucleoid-associated protein Lsr2 n=1 Tax=Gordonia insulae TaxID=2420509 RepID=A0A3G8JHN0_9ACTN|nr:histone-like nucleoid-structuring protein Lsr2 [Gordonia insulae]AZG44514.1 hypothetical protein D7316_01100 [Gordonia insulae]
MARVQHVEIIDDLDGEPIDVADVHTVEVEITLPGRRPARYRLDLRADSLAEFEKDIGRYLTRTESVSDVHQNVRSDQRTRSGRSTRSVRKWALANGYSVATHGRLPNSIVRAFEAAH